MKGVYVMLLNRNTAGMVIALMMAVTAIASAREEISLDALTWRVWLDDKAEWLNDTLYAPGTVPAYDKLPINPPTGGWKQLTENTGKACSLPASVEEYYSGGTNIWTYHGVSWFWCDVEAPANWKGKVVRLAVEKARLRVEIYVNGRLSGYDLVPETPIDVNLSTALRYGEKNRIAIRLTNPGGQRGWADFPSIKWGKNILPPSHDFSGLGRLSLVVTEPVYIDNVFVKNLQPPGANNIEVQVGIMNTTAVKGKKTVEVSVKGTGVTGRREFDLRPGENKVVIPLVVPDAKSWDPDHPELYECAVALEGDALTARFGFRVFDVKAGASGGHNFYLNGRRFVHKSAIDWGYYALTGFYATPEMAKRSVSAAKAIGHNGINFHRRIGEPLILQYADELGLCIYEEPGGFNDWGFAATITEEKCKRMVVRDRNHPSLIINSLCNEYNGWSPLRESVIRKMAALDGSRLVINTSGAQFGKPEDKTKIYHVRPYETELRRDYNDLHNARNMGARFNEGSVYVEEHRKLWEDRAYYAGEVIATTGPSNWYLCAKQREELKPDRPGYDLNIFTGNHSKIAAAFQDWRMAGGGDGAIQGPADVFTLAGSGMLYMMGRHAQSVMANNTADGFAINGWSAGPQCGGNREWDSAMLDEGRNLKGRAEHYRYWVRPAQIAIFRKNGKYFKTGDTVEFELNLINQGVVPKGDYTLNVEVVDGAGKITAFRERRNVQVAGGDCFAQPLDPLKVGMGADWRGGYVSVRATLLRDGKNVADGVEQVLLANRPSFGAEFASGKAGKGAVCNWQKAKEALLDAGVTPADFPAKTDPGILDYVVAAGKDAPDEATVDELLARVQRDGTLLLIQFNKSWAEVLFKKQILSKPVVEWGGIQKEGWNGNGWGYLEKFVGDQAVPGKTVIGTTGWEVPDHPTGFYPFAAHDPVQVYGLYMARPWTGQPRPKEPAHEPTLLVLVGEIRHGKGRILLNAGYPVDKNNPFTDMLFYNMLTSGGTPDKKSTLQP